MDARHREKLVFIGASNFGLKCLDICLQIPDVKVVGIVTAPKTFSISYRPSGVTNVKHADFANIAKANDIELIELKRSMNEPGLISSVESWEPDLMLVVGWYHMIPKSWLQRAPVYGMHASLLPDYSGGAPLVWALINGEPKTGITLFQMDSGVDSGPIAGQREEPIYPDDTIAELYRRIELCGMDLLNETLPQLVSGKVKLKQQDSSKRRIMPQRGPEDGIIQWSKDVDYIDRFIRAQTRPYPGAFSILDAHPIHIWKSKKVEQSEDTINIGQVIRNEMGDFYVKCGRGMLQLLEVSYNGRDYRRSQLVNLFAEGGQQLKNSI